MPSSPEPWRYVIVIACASVAFLCPSTIFSHGVLFVALTETGVYDVSTVAWLISFTNVMHALGAPLGSVLVSLTSCRTALFVSGLAALLGPSLVSCASDIRVLFFSYGVLMGLARGVSISAATVSIGYWFKEDSSIASGLMYTGVGVGMLVHPPLLRALVDSYDVYGALLIMGAISFHTCICGLLTRPARFETERKLSLKQNTNKSADTNFRENIRNNFTHFKKSILTNYSFMLFVLGVSLMMMAFQIIITFMPDFFQYHGSTPQESAMAASITGIGSLISRVLVGILSNDPNIGTMLVFQGNCGTSAIFTLILPVFANSAFGRFTYVIAIGTYLTSLFVILGPTTLQKVGIDDLAFGFGFIYLGTASVSLIGPPLAVKVKVMADSYQAVFVLAGCLLFGACFCGFLSEIFKRPKEEKQNSPVITEILSQSLNDDARTGADTEEESTMIHPMFSDSDDLRSLKESSV